MIPHEFDKLDSRIRKPSYEGLCSRDPCDEAGVGCAGPNASGTAPIGGMGVPAGAGANLGAGAEAGVGPNDLIGDGPMLFSEGVSI